MKELNEVRLITKDEAEILYKALHHWLFEVLYKKKPLPDVLEENQLYEDLKNFVSEEDKGGK